MDNNKIIKSIHFSYIHIKWYLSQFCLKALAKRIPCLSSEHGDNNELESGDDLIGDGLIKKGKETQLEVAIGDGMEFTIHGDVKNKKKNKLINSAKVSCKSKVLWWV